MNGRQSKNGGFTLIELLIVLVIFSIVMAAAYSLFNSQQKSHTAQLAIVDMQQDLRAGMSLMERDIRLAGYDDPIGTKAGAGFTAASASQMGFTMSIFDGIDDDGDKLVDEWDEAGNAVFDGRDNDGDGTWDGYSEETWVINKGGTTRAIDQPDETVIYGFRAADDGNGDGIADAGAAPLGRTDGNGTFNVLMENVNAVAFAYAYDNDNDGFLDRDASGNVIWAVDTDGDNALDTDMAGNAINPNVNDNRIRAVQVWVLARAPSPTQGYVNSQTYTVGSNDITPGDSYLRRLLTTTVLCKNMR